MKKWFPMMIIGVALVVGLMTGCASLRPGPNGYTPAQVRALLVDAQFGLTEACSQEWLTPDTCTFGEDTITLAIAITEHNNTGVQAAVKQTLTDSLTHVPSNSRLRPFMQWLIDAL